MTVPKITKTIPFGEHTLTLETGEIARQASGAVMACMGDSRVLATVVGVTKAENKFDFFPLTVVYTERTYASGSIPGGYFRREGRPTEHETLVSRLIDRPLRPLFPKGFQNEVQVIVTVLSHDPQVNPDILGLVASSAALAISGIPFNGPIGAARVGYREGVYLLNPDNDALQTSQLNLVVAGTKSAVLMVESEAAELSEQIMLGAVLYGHEMMQGVINVIEQLATEVGKPRWTWQEPATDAALATEVETFAKQRIVDCYTLADKTERNVQFEVLKAELIEKLAGQEDANRAAAIKENFEKLKKTTMRNQILDGKPRIDGRDKFTVRPIRITPTLLPRTHGSALFTRGETQAIVTVTLGTERDSQSIETLYGEYRERFMLHYNFPPYSVGEVGQVGSPKRREIGHGRLAKRALQAVLPNALEFPYVLRVVSEITESNGSSSMATVCGASLAMMDAGVPLKAPVAGIAMGLIKDGDRYAVLTDILGDEDHLGDMDFKVAGTSKGVTALQMDIKIQGINKEIMDTALNQALQARLHILGVMNEVMPGTRTDLSLHAPRVLTMKVKTDKIGDIIGKGGATIRALTEEMGVSIDIEDDGTVKVYSKDQATADEAKRRIEALTEEIMIGKIYEGKVTRIVDFGAFVNILPGKDGLLHISQISNDRIENVTDVLQEGQMVRVQVLDLDRQGRVKLSMKSLSDEHSTAHDMQ
jgi:polyribonucleotide nucleotidyltransferase